VRRRQFALPWAFCLKDNSTGVLDAPSPPGFPPGRESEHPGSQRPLCPLNRRQHPSPIRNRAGFGGQSATGRALLLYPCLAIALSGCATLGYYSQATAGQLSPIGMRQAIETLLANPQTPAELKTQLALVLQLRAFAETSLHLPVEGQFGDYADIERDYLLWNVFAAPEARSRCCRERQAQCLIDHAGT
jgi:hypothetical protein